MIENLKRKIKWVLCLIIGFLTFNSIPAVAVENTMLPENVDNYFLTQEHILKSPELYNFIKDTEKGVFPNVSKMDITQKKDFVIFLHKLFNENVEYSEKEIEQLYTNEDFDMLKTYFLEYPHQKSEVYYFAGKVLLFKSSGYSIGRTLQDIKQIQKNLRDKNLSQDYLYVYATNPYEWEQNILILTKNTKLTSDMVKALASIKPTGKWDEEELKQIISDINSTPNIKNKNEYLYNYLIAGTFLPGYINTTYFRKIMKKQKDAIDYLKNINIKFSSIYDESVKIRELIYSKNICIDTLSENDVSTMNQFIFEYANNRKTLHGPQIAYLNKKLTDENKNIINLAYIMSYVNIDEPMKPEIETLFDKDLFDNTYLYDEGRFIQISEANRIYDQLWQEGKATENNLVKAIKKQTKLNHKAADSMTIKQGWGVILGFGPLLLIPLIPILCIVGTIIGFIVLIKKIF